MIALIEQIAAAFALTLVMTYPGAPILALTGVRAALPVPLLPAAALAVTLTLTLPVLVLTLWQGLPIDTVLAWQLALTLAAIGIGLSRRRRTGEAVPAWRWLLRHSPIGFFKALPWALRILAAAAGGIAFAFGGWLDDGDMMYHASVARKLAELPAPTFANIQLFVDGSLHPGYPAPVWHELWAVTARLTGFDVLTVLWMAAVPAAMFATLAMAGLAEVALRSRIAAAAGAAVFLLSDGLARAPMYGGILGTASPTGLTVGVLLPLALSCWLLALWHADSRARRAAGALLVLSATPAILAVHVSYIAFLGLVVAGYAVVWAVRSPWPRRIVRRHLVSGVALALVAATGLAAFAPVLAQLATLDAATDAQAARQEFADFQEILVGDVSSYHLRADMLAQFGGLALAGLMCLPLAVLRRREPVAWLLLGAGLFVIGISQLDQLFMAFSSVASVSQSKRLQFAVPHELGLVFGLMLVAHWSARLWSRRRLAPTIAGGGLMMGAAAALFVLAWRVDPLPRLNAVPDVPAWAVQATLGLLVAALVWMLAELAVRLRSRDRSQPIDPHAPVIVLQRSGCAALAALLCAAAVGVVVPFVPNLRDAIRERPTSALRAYDLADLDGEVIDAVRRAASGTVVVAPPSISLRIAAVAPVYVAVAPPRHVAGTSENRREERIESARILYGKHAGIPERLRALAASDATLVVLEEPEGRPLRQQVADAVAGLDGARRVATGERHVVYALPRTISGAQP